MLLVIKKILLFIIMVSYPMVQLSQNIKRASGMAQLKIEDHVNRLETNKLVEELAKINAIESVFGTYVQSSSELTVNNGKSDFSIIGSTKVKGDWVRTLDIKFSEDIHKGTGTEIWITCQIKGLVRESKPTAPIEVLTLNDVNITNRTTTFLNGESLFVWFKSPIDGFLSIFVDDGDFVYRILPYSSDGSNHSIKVKGDKDYLFFSKAMNSTDLKIIDEIELYTLMKSEVNTLIIIFSENEYLKPILDNHIILEDGYSLPNTIRRNRFEDWIATYKERYDDFIDRKIQIKIVTDINHIQ